MSECPGLDRWEAFATGQSGAAEAAALAEHERLCGPCAEALAGVRMNLGLASRMRELLGESGGPTGGAPGSGAGTPLGLVGKRIDGYTVLRVLGSGESSTVYEAKEERTGRSVAMKVLSALATGPDRLRRFEHEARLLARLRHPGIAAVLGYGEVAEDGGSRPYIAMELVDGGTITGHSDAAGLGTGMGMGIGARLELLAQACEAVEHAHRSGVVHRDLKPANVMVTREGSVRVVDFGIARLTGPDAAMSTMHTAQGHIVGTVAYMSPEHLTGSGSVDARSDVYSLGVIGYELVTGRAPYAVGEGTIQTALRAITLSEPTPPSRVVPALAGEVEAMLLRALEKRPQDRYQSAGELAADLRRYLGGEAVAARRAGALARTGKFARRNRALVVGGVAVVAALLVGLVGTTWGLLRAVERTRVAEERRENAEQLASLLERMLREAHPHEAKGRGYTVRQMLDDFSRRFGDGLERQPMVEASLRTTMGTGYRVLGEYALARPHLERALALRRGATEAAPAATARALCDLAWLDHDEAAYPRAIEGFREAAGMTDDAPVRTRAVLGWSDCLRHAGDLGAATARAREALEGARRLADRSAAVTLAEARLNLSRALRDAGDYEAAGRELDEAMQSLGSGAVNEDDPRLADALNEEAWLAFLRRDVDRAETIARRALAVGTRTLGAGHPDLGNTKYELGMIMASRNDTAGAEALLREALAIYTAAHGERHPSTFTAAEALARVLRTAGRPAESRDILVGVVAGRRAMMGDRNVEVAYALSGLGSAQRDLTELAAAEASIQEALAIYRETYKGPHPFIAKALVTLAQVAQDGGNAAGAQRFYEDAVATNEAALGPGHADTLAAMSALAACVEARGDWAGALAIHDRLLERSQPGSPPGRIGGAHQGRGRCLSALGEPAKAVEAHRAAVVVLDAFAATNPGAAKRAAAAREMLAKAQEAAGDADGASQTRRAGAPSP